MTFYAPVSGSITYERQEDFDAACQFLAENGWLRGDALVDESGAIPDSAGIDRDKRRIDLGHCVVYCNLARHLDVLFRGGRGTVVWTSIDGCFDGETITDGVKTACKLEKWAKEQLGVTMPNSDEDIDAWIDAAFDVQEEFHKRYVGSRSVAATSR